MSNLDDEFISRYQKVYVPLVISEPTSKSIAESRSMLEFCFKHRDLISLMFKIKREIDFKEGVKCNEDEKNEAFEEGSVIERDDEEEEL